MSENEYVRKIPSTQHHPAPWWYRLAERFIPERCREIPEAVNTDRIVLRQVAIIKRYLYLQQFASSEDVRYMHSHQWYRTFALGLWGSYVEARIAGPYHRRAAPYFYTMDASVVHQVFAPSPGHTSLFLGLWRDDDLKHYYGAPRPARELLRQLEEDPGGPITYRRLWSAHIKKMVKRI